MKVASFEYKCRRCNGVSDSAQTAAGRADMVLIGVITGYKPEPMLGMVSTHPCSDGGLGVADLIGYSVKEDDFHKPKQV